MSATETVPSSPSVAAADAPAEPSAAKVYWLTVWTLMRRELVRFLRQRTRVVGALGQPVIFWFLFGAGFAGAFDPPAWAAESMSYQEYFFPGIAVMILLFTAIFSTITVIEDRREGFLQGVLVAPVPRSALVLGKLGGGTALAVGQAVAFMILGPVMSAIGLAPEMSLGLAPLQIIGVLLWLTLVGFALCGLGYMIAWPMNSTAGFHAIMSTFLLPMWLLSGAMFPGEEGWVKWVVTANPLTYGVAGLRHLISPTPLDTSSGHLPSFAVSLVVTLAFAAVVLTFSTLLTRRRTSSDAR